MAQGSEAVWIAVVDINPRLNRGSHSVNVSISSQFVKAVHFVLNPSKKVFAVDA
jgi:hypothetical protein